MNMADLLKYKDIFSQSINEPDVFWGKAAENVIWDKKWDKVLDDSKKPFYRLVCRRTIKYLLQRSRLSGRIRKGRTNGNYL